MGYASPMGSSRPVAITFDAGNTLLFSDPSPAEIYARELSRHGRTVGAEEVGPVFARAWAEMQQRAEPDRDRYSSFPGGERAWWGEFVREVLRRLDHDAEWEPLLADLYAAFSEPGVWKVFPETHATLAEIAHRGIAMAVVSNWDRRLPEILRELGLIERFDAVAISAIEGVEKPSAQIFERALERLNVEASDVIHVGDSPLEDYRGALEAGMTPVLLDRRRAFEDDGYRRITTLDEVLSFL